MKPEVKRFSAFYVFMFFLNALAYAQHEHMELPGMYGGYPMARESSGTSWQPESTPMSGGHWMFEDRTLMYDGYVNAVYDRQGGKRGDEKVFSSSMFMLMSRQELDQGILGLRGMLSLDPTMGKKGYPLLFQNGETDNGLAPLIDRQHPHDLFMEMAATYSVEFSEDSSMFVYLGLPGEPAIGPPAFMHRFSGMDNPSAPVTHHWLDSTHITYGVATLGVVRDSWKLEGSAFRGREPDQDRWDIESPELDSYSARISFNPGMNWAHQVSYGYIDSPEQLEPGVDTGRFTVSTSYNKPLSCGNWQTTLAWGRNDNSPGKRLDGFVFESAARINGRHIFFGRIERVDKDELFNHDDPLHGRTFKVNKAGLGYIYEWPARNRVKLGVGGSLDIGIIPDKLKPAYGRAPVSCMVFVRARVD